MYHGCWITVACLGQRYPEYMRFGHVARTWHGFAIGGMAIGSLDIIQFSQIQQIALEFSTI